MKRHKNTYRFRDPLMHTQESHKNTKLEAIYVPVEYKTERKIQLLKKKGGKGRRDRERKQKAREDIVRQRTLKDVSESVFCFRSMHSASS